MSADSPVANSNLLESLGRDLKYAVRTLRREPSFVAANTGLLGTSQSLIPLRDATIRDGDVVVGYDKDMVTNAPRLGDDEGSLSRGQEQKLYDYYGISYDATKRGAAWTPAEDLTTATGDATTGGHPDHPDDAPATTER